MLHLRVSGFLRLFIIIFIIIDRWTTDRCSGRLVEVYPALWSDKHQHKVSISAPYNNCHIQVVTQHVHLPGYTQYQPVIVSSVIWIVRSWHSSLKPGAESKKKVWCVRAQLTWPCQLLPDSLFTFCSSLIVWNKCHGHTQYSVYTVTITPQKAIDNIIFEHLCTSVLTVICLR